MKYNKNEKVINHTSKPLSEFTKGDTIYIKKMKGGFGDDYLCNFISFERGIIKAEVIAVESEYRHTDFEIGSVITARPKTCFLWGNPEGSTMSWEHCVRFKKLGTEWKAI